LDQKEREIIMKVWSKIIEGSNIKEVEITQDMGIKIEHRGNRYNLYINNHGDLVFNSIDNVQLLVLPKGSNTIEIKSEN